MTTECKTDQEGTKRYYFDGKLHRTDGPAIEWANGDKHWYLHDQRHRTDGPAVEYAGGTKLWYVHGQLHRTDGPAVECANGTKSWWVQGEYLGSGEGCLCLDCLKFCQQQCQKNK